MTEKLEIRKTELAEMLTVFTEDVRQRLLDEEDSGNLLDLHDRAPMAVMARVGCGRLMERKLDALQMLAQGRCLHCGALQKETVDAEHCRRELKAIATELGCWALLLHDAAEEVADRWQEIKEENIRDEEEMA